MPQLTFTRFIACMLVVLYHESNEAVFSNYEKFKSIIKFGDASVSYFFLLSGFILSFNQIKTNNRFNISSAKTFWLKRFARIYPVYFLAFTICFIIFYLNYSIREKLSTGLILSNLTLTQSWFPKYTLNINYPSWSLSVEAFFYLCFPFIFNLFFLNQKNLINYILLAIFFFQGIISSVLLYFNINYYFSPLTHMSTFISGVWLGFIYSKYKKNFQKYSFYISVTAITALLYIINEFNHNLFLSKYYNYGILTPLHMLIILSVITNKFLTRIFSLKPLQYLGEISYSIYILHIPISLIIYGYTKQISVNSTTSLFLYVLFLILFSSWSYRTIEVPMKKKIIELYKV